MDTRELKLLYALAVRQLRDLDALPLTDPAVRIVRDTIRAALSQAIVSLHARLERRNGKNGKDR